MTKIYLIDGHNLIGTGLIPGIHLEQEDDEAQLVAWLRARKSYIPGKVVVVFDGGIPGGTSLQLSGGGVTAVFAAQKRTDADTVIRNRARSSKTPKSVIVVTNDAGLRQKLTSTDVALMTARAFVSLIEENQDKQALARAKSQKEKPHLSGRELDEWMDLFGGEPGEES